uniref:Cupin type-1 domain-containing protein n=1 Tax=Salix viminalis TaxID=40686 RepID=A0A6N2LWA8_SALVM
MKGVHFLVAFVFLALAASFALASDPSPLQDFCVAIDDTKDAVFLNGKFCKDPKLAEAKDFFFSGLDIARNTSNPIGSVITPANVAQIPGLNTLGISMARVDYAPNDPNSPGGNSVCRLCHIEPDNVHNQSPEPGRCFRVPHRIPKPQNPGIIPTANAVFGSTPPIRSDVLAKAFQVDKNIVDHLQKQFWNNNN